MRFKDDRFEIKIEHIENHRLHKIRALERHVMKAEMKGDVKAVRGYRKQLAREWLRLAHDAKNAANMNIRSSHM